MTIGSDSQVDARLVRGAAPARIRPAPGAAPAQRRRGARARRRVERRAARRRACSPAAPPRPASRPGGSSPARAPMRWSSIRSADALLGVAPERSLDALVFSSPTAPWRDVMVAGRWVIRDGVHAEARGDRRALRRGDRRARLTVTARAERAGSFADRHPGHLEPVVGAVDDVDVACAPPTGSPGGAAACAVNCSLVLASAPP